MAQNKETFERNTYLLDSPILEACIIYYFFFFLIKHFIWHSQSVLYILLWVTAFITCGHADIKKSLMHKCMLLFISSASSLLIVLATVWITILVSTISYNKLQTRPDFTLAVKCPKALPTRPLNATGRLLFLCELHFSSSQLSWQPTVIGFISSTHLCCCHEHMAYPI